MHEETRNSRIINYISHFCIRHLILGLAAALFAAPLRADPFDEPMTFSVHTPCIGNAWFCAPYVLAQGVITHDTPKRFSIFLDKYKYKPRIYFHSPGGDLSAGIKMGYIIRKAGLDTFVGGPYEEEWARPYKFTTLVRNGSCFSACAYAFLGGVIRELNDAGRYGVHQFAGAKKDTGQDAAQTITAVLANYLDDMGVDRKLLDIASVTHASDLQVIPVKVARALNVDNTDPPKSEWELKADDGGKLFMFTIQRRARSTTATGFFITREGGALVGTLRYEFEWKGPSNEATDKTLNERTKLVFTANNQTFELWTPTGWNRVKNGIYTVSFSLPRTVLQAILNANTFVIDIGWPHFIADYPDMHIEFGTVGFQNALSALANN